MSRSIHRLFACGGVYSPAALGTRARRHHAGPRPWSVTRPWLAVEPGIAGDTGADSSRPPRAPRRVTPVFRLRIRASWLTYWAGR
jgi:hypothetical protein